MNHLRRNISESVGVSGTTLDRASLGQQAFHRLISLERRRAERSRKSFFLMLVDTGQPSFGMSERIMEALMPMTRETDAVGWYKERTIAGVLFTEITDGDLTSTSAVIMNRVSKTLKSCLTSQQFASVSLSFHLLPEDQDRKPTAVHTATVAATSVTPPSFAVELQ